MIYGSWFPFAICNIKKAPQINQRKTKNPSLKKQNKNQGDEADLLVSLDELNIIHFSSPLIFNQLGYPKIPKPIHET